jgi:hypothetical protein
LTKSKKENEMNTKRVSMVAVMAFVVVTAAVSPSLASAQTEFQGKFTLPCTTYWGNEILPAGAYTFSIADASRASGQVAFLKVHGPKSLEMTVMVKRGEYVKESALEVRRSAGSAVITSLHLAGIRVNAGIGMNFRAAPAAKELLASASTPAVAEKIMLTVD